MGLLAAGAPGSSPQVHRVDSRAWDGPEVPLGDVALVPTSSRIVDGRIVLCARQQIAASDAGFGWSTPTRPRGREVPNTVVARDIMTRNVLALASHVSAAEARDVLLRHRVDGAPVVDATSAVVGLVTIDDMAGGQDATVGEIMDPDPVYAAEDTPVETVVRLMLERATRYVLVLRGDRVVGLVASPGPLRDWLHPAGT